jgi:MFS family permease
MFELRQVKTERPATTAAGDLSHIDAPEDNIRSLYQGVPPELSNHAAEIIFVLTCSAGQIIYSLTLGHISVTQTIFRESLEIEPTQTPWLVGSSMLASGLSVIIFGSLADLAPPKPLMVGAFVWEALWNIVTALSIRPTLKILFFVARVMQGLAVGVLVSSSMSILGRVYNPGIRKTRVFSLMAAGAPFGYWIGCVQGGALKSHLSWIFGSTAIFLAVCAIAAQYTIPPLRPVSDRQNTDVPSLRQFDYAGAFLSSLGCGLILFGLTQGSSTQWNPYTYSSIILGFLVLIGFYFIERRVARPLIPNGLWKTPGFAALLISYFLGFGAYSKFVATTVPHT